MAEFPTSPPVPQKDDDLAIIDGAALQTEPGRDGFASLKALLPEVRDGDLNGVLAALGTAGKLDAFRALLADPVR